MPDIHTYQQLAREIEIFVSEREWHRFHSPKNLSMALSVEVAELVEIFQWLSADESRSAGRIDRVHLEEEIGDVMIYLSMLCGTFDIDPVEAALKKMAKNRKKYPAELVRGSADKSTACRRKSGE
ncbi:MAG TPA: nucleotide pyrophosphohydrolase [Desulfopila sp.]|nr:nucleotide pyrophosphohydrolase [Desulfopila sp.]